MRENNQLPIRNDAGKDDVINLGLCWNATGSHHMRPSVNYVSDGTKFSQELPEKLDLHPTSTGHLEKVVSIFARSLFYSDFQLRHSFTLWKSETFHVP